MRKAPLKIGNFDGTVMKASNLTVRLAYVQKILFCMSVAYIKASATHTNTHTTWHSLNDDVYAADMDFKNVLKKNTERFFC